jgi:hypothetical protein
MKSSKFVKQSKYAIIIKEEMRLNIGTIKQITRYENLFYRKAINLERASIYFLSIFTNP